MPLAEGFRVILENRELGENLWRFSWVPSGKHAKNYGKSQCLMGKLTISMAIFNSILKISLPEGKRLVSQPASCCVRGISA